MSCMPALGSLLCVALYWVDEVWLSTWHTLVPIEEQFIHVVVFGLAQGVLLMWTLRNLWRFNHVGTWLVQLGLWSVATVCAAHRLSVLRPQHGEMATMLGAARTSIHAWRLVLFKEEYASLTNQQPLPVFDLAAVDVMAALLVLLVVTQLSNYRWYHNAFLLTCLMVALHVYFQVPTPDALWVQQLWQAAYNQWLGPDHGPFTEPAPIHNAATTTQ